MAIQPVVIGGTYDWFLKAKINTQAAPTVFGIWDLTGATVTINFIPPSGTASHLSASVVSASAGTAHYVNLAALFSVAGTWQVSWKVSKSGTILETELESFTVYASGAAAA